MKKQLTAINERIAAACQRAGRLPSEVTLVAVSKTFPSASVREAIDAGASVFGENRVQEAAAKIAELAGITAERQIQWHLIGHLQSNKARRAVELFDAIHSVDNLKLAERLNTVAEELGKRLPIFIEVNVGGEAAKSGVAPGEVMSLCERTYKLASLELKGLMCVPPFLDDPEAVRPYFRRLRELRETVQRQGIVGTGFTELSMGMSNDFEVAIEEGATFVRVGSALFGARA